MSSIQFKIKKRDSLVSLYFLLRCYYLTVEVDTSTESADTVVVPSVVVAESVDVFSVDELDPHAVKNPNIKSAITNSFISYFCFIF